jgi:hypothetical protein
LIRRITWVLLFLSAGFQASAQQVLMPEEIARLIPDRLRGFQLSADPKTRLVQLGNIRYSLVEKSFSSGKGVVKILLFDYKEAPIMFSQATRKWSNLSPVTTDSVVLESFSLQNCTGWETFNVRRNASQVVMGICDRFFLTIEAQNVSTETLRNILQQFRFDTFPK